MNNNIVKFQFFSFNKFVTNIFYLSDRIVEIQMY